MKIVAVIPTYNESENIKKLVPKLLEVSKKMPKYQLEILIVDDSSPDGTGRIVKSFSKAHKNVHLLTGKKRGLGVAYLRGFRKALKDMNAEIVIMMDADFSHDPAAIPSLLKPLENGYDFVIGSRYIKGGSIPEWSYLRRLVSWGGNMFVRLVGGLYSVHDCTSGFRAIRASTLRKINPKYLDTKGYGFQSTLLYESRQQGANVAEVPITFIDRKFGETKLKTDDIVEFVLNSWRIRLKTQERFNKFLIVGFSGVLVNIGILWALKDGLGLFYLISGAIAIELSILYNFIINDKWTFRDLRHAIPFRKRLARFNAAAAYSALINLSILYLLTTWASLYYLLSNIIGIFFATSWNYFVNKGWTWRNNK